LQQDTKIITDILSISIVSSVKETGLISLSLSDSDRPFYDLYALQSECIG